MLHFSGISKAFIRDYSQFCSFKVMYVSNFAIRNEKSDPSFSSKIMEKKLFIDLQNSTITVSWPSYPLKLKP